MLLVYHGLYRYKNFAYETITTLLIDYVRHMTRAARLNTHNEKN
jgi:hypothetical protein